LITNTEYKNLVSEYKLSHNGKEPTIEELQEFKEKRERIKENLDPKGVLSKALNAGSDFLSDTLGLDKDTSDKVIAGAGIATAGAVANKIAGNPVQKGFNYAGDLLSKVSPFTKTEETLNSTHNASPNYQNTKTDYTPKNENTHFNSPNNKIDGGLGGSSTHKPTFMNRVTQTFDKVKGLVPESVVNIAGTALAPTSLGDSTIKERYKVNNAIFIKIYFQ